MKRLLTIASFLLVISCTAQEEKSELKLWYDRPAETWNEALPVGNGRLGAMIFGGVIQDRIQFNEETLWTGAPNNYAHKGAVNYLEDIRQLLREGKQNKAHTLAMKEFMSIPLTQKEYQPFGDLFLYFPDHKDFSAYHRELDISRAVCQTSYVVDEVNYTREIIASHPDQIIAIHINADKKGALNFALTLGSGHEQSTLESLEDKQVLNVAVKEGALRGTAGLRVETDGELGSDGDRITIKGATSATLYVSAATNFVSYKDVSEDPLSRMEKYLNGSHGKSFKEIQEAHVSDYQELFNRFSLDLGSNGRDTIPTNMRLLKFAEAPDDPSLIALYTQYGRYLMISASRKGTQPSNLQGIWNKDLKPAWGS
ncbi:MAG: glycoside hydrolase family 95 protein, partial [Bacteroidales bacterium]|nr:glycoside hydrolase family 95 protein [Bacteroidales bacterium]